MSHGADKQQQPGVFCVRQVHGFVQHAEQKDCIDNQRDEGAKSKQHVPSNDYWNGQSCRKINSVVRDEGARQSIRYCPDSWYEYRRRNRHIFAVLQPDEGNIHDHGASDHARCPKPPHHVRDHGECVSSPFRTGSRQRHLCGQRVQRNDRAAPKTGLFRISNCLSVRGPREANQTRDVDGAEEDEEDKAENEHDRGEDAERGELVR